jgi:ABC-type dipeptide/oligopeptide/nickel transport system permease subunit
MRFQRFAASLGLTSLLIVSQAGLVFASSANISHSYKTDGHIPAGSLVSLDPKQAGTVELTDPTNASRLVGVAVQTDDSLLAVNATNVTTQVANSGTVEALVSSSNGTIVVGDQIGVSPFRGVGMKADDGTRIVGLAQTTFNSSSKGAVTEELTDKSGKKQKVTVGFVRVSIAIGTASTSKVKLNGLQKLAQDIAGHPVSTARIVLSAAIAVIALAALITLVYGAIYGSIIAVGRNPLAKFAIFRTLTSVMFMALATAAVALVTIYLFLR